MRFRTYTIGFLLTLAIAVLIVKTIDIFYICLIGGLFCFFVLGWVLFELNELNEPRTTK